MSKSGTCDTGDKRYGNFVRKFLENPKIAQFPKYEPFNRKFGIFREENQMGQKFPVIATFIYHVLL